MMDALTAGKGSRKKTEKASASNGRGSSNGNSNSDQVDSKLLLTVLTAVKRGDFSPRLPVAGDGLRGRSTTPSTK